MKDLGAGNGQIGLFYILSQIIPLSNQQSRISAIARGGFWLAQYQPGVGFLARDDDWVLFMGKGQPQFPFIPTAIVTLRYIVPAWFKFKITGNIEDELQQVSPKGVTKLP